MKTSLVRTVASDGLELSGLLHEPESVSRGAVVLVHGSAGSFYSSVFADFLAESLTGAGWTFLRGHNRGHGHFTDFGSTASQDGVRIGNASERFGDCVRDIDAWISVVGDAPVLVLMGHSLGASKVIHYAANPVSRAPDAIVLASPVDMVRLYQRDPQHEPMLAMAKEMIRDNRGDQLVPGLTRDCYFSTANHYVEWTQRGGMIDVFNVENAEADSPSLAKIAQPILAFLGDGEGDLLELKPNDELNLHRKRATNCARFDVEVISDSNHVYAGRQQVVAELVTGWLGGVFSSA